MDAQDRSRSPSRRPSRVEQVVGRWLRRSRDLGSRSHSAGRDRSTSEEKTSQSSVPDQRSYAFRFTVQLQRDPGFCSHGLTLSSHTPIVVQDITPGGPADGRLVPGDRLVKINNVCADDLTPAQAAEIIRECHDTLSMTVLRTMLGPKSSFITPEKKAKLKCHPVKVRFAEEVEVNGQSQGNSLLFLPNVLKVYLENGQTKAFKFDPSTTVKDIVMTLKEKLSLTRIEHFSLVLEQQPGVTKLLQLHEDERIQQVVQKKEPHDYRCLFRACFIPREPQVLLEEDPAAFEYLFLQGVNDVLQERFAVEMKCNTALRLAALHIQERLASSGYSPKTNLKTITKTWGIESFVSTTLLRNMKEKDLKKAINYHLKKSLALPDSKLKISSVDQARINYLEELCDLKSFGGKSFSATLMLQDRESTVNLLVGARYGVSQVVNRKLSIMTALTDFNSITRVELVPESDRVSLVKIYVQDIKPITLLLETASAKDMSCLIAGYCRVFIDPNINVFPWTDNDKKHKISAEEGYVSRCGSDSDTSTDIDFINSVTSPRNRSSSESHGIRRKERVKRRKREVKEKAEKPSEERKEEDKENITPLKHERIETAVREIDGGAEEHQSEASDSCHGLTSLSCDSLDALEEDDLLSCSSHHLSQTVPLQLHPYTPEQSEPHLLAPPPAHSHPLLHPNTEEAVCRKSGDGADPQILTPPMSPSTSFQNPCSDNISMRFAELSRLADFLPSPPEASEEEEDIEEELKKRREQLHWEGDSKDKTVKTPSPSTPPSNADYVFNFEQKDARCYYNLVSNITPDSARSMSQRGSERGSEGDSALEQVPILQPPPGFGDSSSEEEFFDARDQLGSPEDSKSATSRDPCMVTEGAEPSENNGKQLGFRAGGERLSQLRKRSRKRRSYLETDYTSTVTFPEPNEAGGKRQHRKNLSIGYFDSQMLSSDPEPSAQTQNPSPTVSSLTHSEGEPSQLESKPILSNRCSKESLSKIRTSEPQNITRKQEMEMEPDAMESKSVTELVKPPSPNITVVRCRVDPDGKESTDRTGDGKEETIEETKCILNNGPFESHMFLPGKTENIVDLISENAKVGNGPIRETVMAIEQNSYIDEYIVQDVICNSKSFCPPPAPPSSPFITVLRASQNECLEMFNESTKDLNLMGTLELAQSNSITSQTDGSANLDETLTIACSTRTASEEVTDSTTSDNVFEDDEGSISLNSNLSDSKHDWVVATRKSFIVDTIESQIGNSKTKRLYSLSSDFSCALYSITSKLGPTSNDISPDMQSVVPCLNAIETTNNLKLSLTKDLASPSLAKQEVSLSSPSHLMFQAWSPSIMGRLSASTLRGKIQSLPFYLSRSVEAINQAGVISPSQSPDKEISQDKEITISVTDINNVTETVDMAIESVETDESDSTVTGSDLDLGTSEEKKEETTVHNVETVESLLHCQLEDQKQPKSDQIMPGPVIEPPTSIASHFQQTEVSHPDTPGPVTTAPQSKMRLAQPGEDVPGIKSSPSIIPPIVVTTQSLSEVGEPQKSGGRDGEKIVVGPESNSKSSPKLTGDCSVFTVTEEPSQTKTSLDTVPVKSGCPVVSGCGMGIGVDPLDACGCSSVYTNCFSDGDAFDEELTVYEFSCRTESSGPKLNAVGLPLITSPPVAFLTTSSGYSPSFPRSVLSSNASELSPLLSPLSDDCPQSHSHKETLQCLLKQQYPGPSSGFPPLRADVDKVLTVLESNHSEQPMQSPRGQHPRDTCPAHFTENKRVLQIEARRFMTGCHQVVGIEQSPEEMFCSLVECFHILVGLSSLVMWFSSCERCERRNTEAVSGLMDVTRSFRDFCVAAERASSKRSCQDLSTKLLAKQCTALNASVFCLTQLFRTLTAL